MKESLKVAAESRTRFSRRSAENPGNYEFEGDHEVQVLTFEEEERRSHTSSDFDEARLVPFSVGGTRIPRRRLCVTTDILVRRSTKRGRTSQTMLVLLVYENDPLSGPSCTVRRPRREKRIQSSRRNLEKYNGVALQENKFTPRVFINKGIAIVDRP
ncbi:hypothetical protein K0M31_011736 [Melipona bicolor]|uniref:Uncharacterized protein n=1 Tax=Melipona bicolor TaxID=60889 RepID=A0AA40GA48_9HYME|nr:hypothetical protein K0M31_011736 [Melipona bicolor]